MSTVYLNTPAQVASMVVRAQQLGQDFRLPVLRAAASGEMALILSVHALPVPARFLQHSKPTVITLCDDHPDATGPARWKQVRRLLRWGNMIVLHATGGQAIHYEMVVAWAHLMGRVLLVEMQQRHHDEWLGLAKQYLPRVKIRSFVPPLGDTHPRMTVPAGTVIQ